MDGNTETDYTADEVFINCFRRNFFVRMIEFWQCSIFQTPNISYVNVHAVLDARRNRAKTLSSDDPNSPQAQVVCE